MNLTIYAFLATVLVNMVSLRCHLPRMWTRCQLQRWRESWVAHTAEGQGNSMTSQFQHVSIRIYVTNPYSILDLPHSISDSQADQQGPSQSVQIPKQWWITAGCFGTFFLFFSIYWDLFVIPNFIIPVDKLIFFRGLWAQSQPEELIFRIIYTGIFSTSSLDSSFSEGSWLNMAQHHQAAIQIPWVPATS